MSDKAKSKSLDEAVNSSELEQSFGERLKGLRVIRKLSQRDLANKSGIANTTISLIEKGKISPSLSSIKKILDGLNVTLSDFFSDNLIHEPQIFYHKEQLKKLSDHKGVTLFQIGWDIADQNMQILRGIYEIGGDTGSEMMAHTGEEGGFIVSGIFELTVGNDIQILSTGDAYYFESSKPHRFRNVGTAIGEIISAQSPPSV